MYICIYIYVYIYTLTAADHCLLLELQTNAGKELQLVNRVSHYIYIYIYHLAVYIYLELYKCMRV